MLEKNCFIKYDMHIKKTYLMYNSYTLMYEDIYLNYKASNHKCSFKI